MFIAVNEASRTFSPLSEGISNFLLKIISSIMEKYENLNNEMSLKECAHILQKTEYRMESTDYVIEMLKNQGNKQ